MSNPENELEPILLSLRSKQDRYQSELDELNGRSAGVAAKLEQIRAAIAALEGNSNSQVKVSPSKVRTKKRRLPDESHIESIVEQILQEKGNIKTHALEQLVRGKLLADGFSRMGVAKQLVGILQKRSMTADANQQSLPTG